MLPRAEKGGLWIAWPKKSGGRTTDITIGEIREQTRALGLVEFKICSIDDDWSAIRVSQKRPAADKMYDGRAMAFR